MMKTEKVIDYRKEDRIKKIYRDNFPLGIDLARRHPIFRYLDREEINAATLRAAAIIEPSFDPEKGKISTYLRRPLFWEFAKQAKGVLDLPANVILGMRAKNRWPKIVSLDKPLSRGTNDRTLKDIIHAPAELLPEVTVQQNERSRAVQDGLKVLQPNQRLAATRRYMEGVSVKDISKELHISKREVDLLLRQARKALKNILKPCDE